MQTENRTFFFLINTMTCVECFQNMALSIFQNLHNVKFLQAVALNINKGSEGDNRFLLISEVK